MEDEKKSLFDIWEILESAKINFDNAVKMQPGLDQNPMFKVAMMQLQEGVADLHKYEG